MSEAFEIRDGVLVKYNGEKEKNVVVPSGVRVIGEYAFYGCKGVERIVLPEGVVEIKHDAITLCSNLTEVVLPQSLRVMQPSAIVVNSKLTELTLPDGIEHYYLDSLGRNKYNITYRGKLYDATQMEDLVTHIAHMITEDDYYTLTFPEGTKEIACPGQTSNSHQEYSRKVIALRNVVIPDGAESIAALGFNNCRFLESVEIPDSVTSIGIRAFYQCTRLKNIKLPAGLTAISEETFCDCRRLAEIEIPDSVRVIGAAAFKDCAKLAKIKLPDGLTVILPETFYCCKELGRVEIPDSVKYIARNAFLACVKATFQYKGRIYDYQQLDGLIKELLGPFTVDDETGSVLIGYQGSETEITVPEGIGTIGSYYYPYDEDDELYDGPYDREEDDYEPLPLEGCEKVEIIHLPASVKVIESFAFDDCGSLREIVIAEDNPYFCSIDGAVYTMDDRTLVFDPRRRPDSSGE